MQFNRDTIKKLLERDAKKDIEETPSGVTVQLLRDPWKEIIFSSGLLSTRVLAIPGYMVGNFVSCNTEEIEQQIIAHIDDSSAIDNDIPFLHLREVQEEYICEGFYRFKYTHEFLKKFFDVCDQNNIPIVENTFLSFAALYEITIPESAIVAHFTEREKNYISSWKKTDDISDEAISNFLQDRKTFEYSDRAYFCKIGRYERSIIEQICFTLIYQILNAGYSFKKCELCGKWFVPQKADEKYCLRKGMRLDGKNCKSAAKYMKQLARERSSESARLYKSINTMKARKANEAPLSVQEEARAELYAFRDAAFQWKSKVKSGEKSEEEFIEWLNSFKVRKKKQKPPQC
jgi:hypothetical protein